MKSNLWTTALVSAGLVSLPSVLHAEESATSVLTSLTPTTLGGYVDTSAQWNIGTGNANVPNYAFGGPGKADGFNLNAVKVSLEKPISAEEIWSAGYKVDLMYGPDANLLGTQSLGATSDFAVRQAYVALHAPLGNGLDVKLGLFDTIMGYEVVDAINNPNFTRSYGFSIEGIEHTGLLATYQFCSALTASAGVANTFGPRINERAFPERAESYKAYMGSLTFTAPESWGFLAGSTLNGTIMNGFNSASPAVDNLGHGDQTTYYIGTTINTPLKNLKVGAAYDYAGVSEQVVTDNHSGYANATTLYLLYKPVEKLTFNVRGEYATSGFTSTFLARKVFAVTSTVQYDLWKNVVSRVEFRWDHAADGSTPYGGTDAGEPGDKANSYILLLNLAYKF